MSTTRLGPYVLTERLGPLGMANLYRAVHTGPNGFEKPVVVKALMPAFVDNREVVDLFAAEARTSAQVSHPGIAQVYDFGVDEGTPYVVTEHLDGINLAQLMGAVAASGRQLPVGVALVIATEMSQALGFAHTWRDRHGIRRQIIHSDVSPEKVMVCRDGSVKLLDLGAARIVDQLDVDVAVRARGKLAYLAPEQVNRLPFDRRVDVFAVGVVLHEMLTGRRLFTGHNDLDTFRRINAGEVPPPSAFNRDIPPELDQLTLKALARDPDDRFSDGEAMAAALQQIRYVGSGRRRVADFIATLFPDCGQPSCEVCHKPLVPVLMCVQCGNDASAAKSAPPPEAPPPQQLPPPPPQPQPQPRPVAETTTARKSVEPERTGLYRTLISVGVVGVVLAVGAVVRERPVVEVAPASPPPVAAPQPPVPPPSAPEPPVLPATKPPQAVTSPKPKTEARHHSKERPKPAPLPTPPVTRDDAPRVERVQTPDSVASTDPRLLDPFAAQ